ncbi:hypothetical protein Bca52824_019927 [Brassica carinata]|uniref:Dof-type domain-containing protein n=1 Tax=Brassica carinata TaxID=52824 RepID=A0A8X7VT39_BRACI|nr:hypothetical protein Bca52824_019927 [Brassica carinata]
MFLRRRRLNIVLTQIAMIAATTIKPRPVRNKKKNCNNKRLHASHNSKPETVDKDEATFDKQSEETKTLRCPRCQSMDTKFCYSNIYKINQPCHFCKAYQRLQSSIGDYRCLEAYQQHANPMTSVMNLHSLDESSA